MKRLFLAPRRWCLAALVLSLGITPLIAEAGGGGFGGFGGGGGGFNWGGLAGGIANSVGRSRGGYGGHGNYGGHSNYGYTPRVRSSYPQSNYYPQPQYRQPQYSQPQYRPQPAAPRYAAPKPKPVLVAPATITKNVVKAPKRVPKNDGFALTDQDFTEMSGKLAARQADEARKLGNQLSAALSDAVAKLGDKEIQDAWDDVLKAGSRPEDLAAFRDQFGERLGADARGLLALRIDVGGVMIDLAAEAITPTGQAQAFARLLAAARRLNPGGPQDAAIAGVNRLNVLLELLRLVGLARRAPQPLDVIFVGFQNAGFGPAAMGDLTGLPLMIDPVPNKDPIDPAAIYLFNPPETEQIVNYNLGAYPYAMKSGQNQSLDQSYVLAFDPGVGGTSSKQYTLKTGCYKWVLTDKGWDLNKVKVAVTIDNSQYDGEFRFLADGKEATLAPGEMAELTSTMPIVLEFDYGDESKPAYKVLTSGEYLVGVDIAQQRLDLFDAVEHTDLIAARGSATSPAASGGVLVSQPDAEIAETLARLKAGQQ